MTREERHDCPPESGCRTCWPELAFSSVRRTGSDAVRRTGSDAVRRTGSDAVRRTRPEVSPRGFVLWENETIVVVATLRSQNGKTGDMVQTWIMRKDRAPHVAVRDGSDEAVCGDCRHRPSREGSCYVVTARAPLRVWRAWKEGAYPRASARWLRKLRGRLVRLGSYGDPAFVPVRVWAEVLRHAGGWTGYTHQWRSREVEACRTFLMASVDSEEEQREAALRGWRTFRVRAQGESLLSGERACPASAEAGYRAQCEDCLSCSGASSDRRDVAIVVHGTTAGRFRRHLPIAVA